MKFVYSSQKVLFILFASLFFNCASLFDSFKMKEYPIELQKMEREIFHVVNNYRRSINLRELEWNRSINFYARQHSQLMANKKAPFNHERFDWRLRKIGMTVRTNAGAENLAFNPSIEKLVYKTVMAWLNSPGHKKNIEGDYDLTGVGIAKTEYNTYYFTQIFVIEN
jgi:uncharacterized protein YkwD